MLKDNRLISCEMLKSFVFFKLSNVAVRMTGIFWRNEPIVEIQAIMNASSQQDARLRS